MTTSSAEVKVVETPGRAGRPGAGVESSFSSLVSGKGKSSFVGVFSVSGVEFSESEPAEVAVISEGSDRGVCRDGETGDDERSRSAS